MKNVLITGGSSGLGAALALAYAADKANLFLSGRNPQRLETIAKQCVALGSTVETRLIDVVDEQKMKAWIEEVDQKTPLDLVIANAGISAGTGEGEETAAQSKAIFDTNLMGVLNTSRPALDLMKKRGKGQVALMASLAGFRGMAGAPSYMASKAAVRVYGESLRLELADDGIAVNVICPGFVKTPMTDVNKFPMPFLMSPERAAQIMKKGLEKNKARISFPWPMSALVWFIAMLPAAWIDGLLACLPRKG